MPLPTLSRCTLISALVFSLSISSLASADDGRCVIKTGVLPDSKEMVVVAEGEREPRSVGSYTLRLYAKNDPAYPFDRFVKGIVRSRNGVIDDLRFEDVDGDGKPEIIVIVRYAGSGAYISADAFSAQGKAFRLVASISGLAADRDPIQALKHKHGKRRP